MISRRHAHAHRHVRRAALSALVLLSIVGCIEGHSGATFDTVVGPPIRRDTPQGVADITGRATDFATGAPLPGTRVFVGNLEVFADVNGNYRLTGAQPTAVTLQATRDGYQPLTAHLAVVPGSNSYQVRLAAAVGAP
jgi:hypothetical protein